MIIEKFRQMLKTKNEKIKIYLIHKDNSISFHVCLPRYFEVYVYICF